MALTVEQLEQRIAAEHARSRDASRDGCPGAARDHRANCDRMLDMWVVLRDYERGPVETPC